jgi:prepilin-type processing-associated H-X9-DG protein
MKIRQQKANNQALTLIDVLVIILILILLAGMLLVALAASHKRSSKMGCTDNLKQVGLAFRIWTGDNNDKYPMELSVKNGGTMELLGGPDAWKTFQVMSNELSAPKILCCPKDSARAGYATNFDDDLKNKISYFIGLDANLANPNYLLSGDDNFVVNRSPIKPGLIQLTPATSVTWNTDRHGSDEPRFWVSKKLGNLLFADGSVQSVGNSGLTSRLQQTGLATNRLAIP